MYRAVAELQEAGVMRVYVLHDLNHSLLHLIFIFAPTEASLIHIGPYKKWEVRIVSIKKIFALRELYSILFRKAQIVAFCRFFV